MNTYIYALCWALPLFLLAVLSVFGMVTDSVAQPLFASLPLLAVIAINARTRCTPKQAV